MTTETTSDVPEVDVTLRREVEYIVDVVNEDALLDTVASSEEAVSPAKDGVATVALGWT